MKHSPHPALAAGALALAFASIALPANAATEIVFSDDFGTTGTGLTLNSFGYYAQANSGGAPGVQTTQNTGSTMTGYHLGTGGSSANVNVIKQWFAAPITLMSAGDSLSVSLDVDSRAAYNATLAQNLVVAFYNSSYEITANTFGGGAAGPFNNKAVGYGYSQSSAGGSIQQFTNYAVSTALGDSAPAVSAVPSGLYDQNVHTITFSVTKETVGASFAFSVGSTVVYSHTDTTATDFTFNTLRLQLPGIATNGMWIDNISVAHTTAVPEPSSAAALGGLAALGLVAVRRRRRSE